MKLLNREGLGERRMVEELTGREVDGLGKRGSVTDFEVTRQRDLG